MITQELEDNINDVHADARLRGLKDITVEHLTLILVQKNAAVRELLGECCADTEGLARNLTAFLAERVAQAKTAGVEPKPTVGFQRVLQRAVTQANKNETTQKPVSGVHVLAAIFGEPESYAAYFLQKHGIERLRIFAQLAKQAQSGGRIKTPAKDKKNEGDLVSLAAAGALEAPLGRERELTALMRILGRKYKNNPLLVGEPGVGKTALAYGLAHRIAAGDAPPHMRGMRLAPVSITDLVAGTKYRGDFEQRLRQLTERCRAHGKTVLFIDEIHTVVGAGAVSGSVLDAANMLKPLLSDGNIRTIGATTFHEYRRFFEKDGALSRRFQKVEVREPDDETLAAILAGVIERLSQHHGVVYAPEAAAAAAELSRRHLPNRFLPDKAIDLLDDAGAEMRLRRDTAAPIGEALLAEVAARAAGLPPPRADDLADLTRRLSQAVFDQPEAARRLARAVARARFGVGDGGGAVSAFLFTGPTGVGKTEMARQLARVFGMPLLRYDMSEYMERHAVSRLIGAPPGYVGFEQNGKLCEDIFRHPNAVVLLDEVEKAHPDVLNILLQILDYGALTDNSGRAADFSNALIVLTSNLGAAEMERGASGFVRDDGEALANEAVRRFFSPEFRNRLEAVIRFAPLSPATIERVLAARLTAILARVTAKKNLRVTVGGKLRAALKRDGFSKSMGARPLQRLLRERILEPLALADADGALQPGGRYRLEISGDDVAVQAVKTRRRAAVSA